MKSNILKILLIVAAFTALGSKAYAADLDITCDPDDGSTSCTVLPSNTAALFDPTDTPNPSEYPLSDMKPGDTVKRKIYVHNNGRQTCYFTINSAEVTNELYNFSHILQTEITDGVDSTGYVPFSDIFENTPIYLGTLGGGTSKTFDWNVLFPITAGNEYQRANLVFNFTWNFSCGEEPELPKLYIAKSNDSYPDLETPGVQVLFTLVINTNPNPVDNVEVVDLPAEGFAYVPGSWTAHSDLRGDLKGLGITPEPTYHSPGVWQLGNMAPNETVTLTYKADTESSADEGLYKDLAWAKGTAGDESLVLANDESAYFVGTLVRIGVEPSTPKAEVKTETKQEEEEEVLGASTILPATGASTKWFLSIAGLFLLGVIFIYAAYKLRKSLHSLILIFVLFAVFGGTALAASPNLTVRLFEPETPILTSSVDLNFVALDINNREIKVECYKKGPVDAGFTKFGPDINLIPGGNSDICVADSSVLSDEGSYDFYVVATADLESATSSTVTFSYDSNLPGKPKYIEKSKNTSCSYDIKFKTAADGGETDHAEVYRSDEKEFDVNDSNKIGTYVVGSDSVVEFEDTKPNCGKTYYYAVRAFDNAGNASSVRTEVIEKTETTTKTVTDEGTQVTTEGVSGGAGGAGGGAIPVSESGIQPEAGEVEGEVAGVETEQPAEVLSAKDILSNKLAWGLLISVVLAILIIIYAKNKKRKVN